ncbi:MAG: VOC family protein, partial [Burkholderiales bacterium]|nr:VOC family protein [Phycisphaerae bacterium]
MIRFPVCALRSVELGTPDLDVSERFYTTVWGLDVAARTADAVYLRGTGSDHHIVALRQSDASELRSVTFRAASADDLAAIRDAAAARGAELLS